MTDRKSAVVTQAENQKPSVRCQARKGYRLSRNAEIHDGIDAAERICLFIKSNPYQIVLDFFRVIHIIFQTVSRRIGALAEIEEFAAPTSIGKGYLNGSRRDTSVGKDHIAVNNINNNIS